MITVEKLPEEVYWKYDLKITQGAYSVYSVPELHEAIQNIKDSFGKQYDPIEGKIVEGGLPVLWSRTDG